MTGHPQHKPGTGPTTAPLLVEDLLFPVSGERGAVNVPSAQATIEVPELERYLGHLAVLSSRFPLELFGNALHEGAHHQSLCTLVGTALSILAAEIREKGDDWLSVV